MLRISKDGGFEKKNVQLLKAVFVLMFWKCYGIDNKKEPQFRITVLNLNNKKKLNGSTVSFFLNNIRMKQQTKRFFAVICYKYNIIILVLLQLFEKETSF